MLWIALLTAAHAEDAWTTRDVSLVRWPEAVLEAAPVTAEVSEGDKVVILLEDGDQVLDQFRLGTELRTLVQLQQVHLSLHLLPAVALRATAGEERLQEGFEPLGGLVPPQRPRGEQSKQQEDKPVAGPVPDTRTAFTLDLSGR